MPRVLAAGWRWRSGCVVGSGRCSCGSFGFLFGVIYVPIDRVVTVIT